MCPITLDEIDSKLKRYNLHDSLLMIGEFSLKLFNNNTAFESIQLNHNYKTYNIVISQWFLALLAFRLIMVSNDGKQANLSQKELVILDSQAGDLYDPFLKDLDLAGFLGRISHEQFWWQGNIKAKLARNYILLNNLAQKYKQEQDIEKEFYSMYKLSFYEYLMIGSAILGICTKQPYFKKEQIINHKIEALKEVLVEDKLDRFLVINSASYNTFRQSSSQINKIIKPGFEKYQFNPLFKYPIIQSDHRFLKNVFNHPYIIPNMLLLVRRICDGIYWQLREIYKMKASSESRGFLSLFGRLFEEYVGDILKAAFGDTNVRKPIVKGNKIADWIVLVNNIIIIIECKSQLMPFYVTETFGANMYEGWIRANIIKGIEQLLSTENILVSTQALGEIRYSNEKIYKLLVSYENLYNIENPFNKKLLIEILNKEVYAKYPNVSKGFDIMSIDEMECIEVLLQEYKLTAEQILSKKEELDSIEDITKGHSFFDVYKEVNSTAELVNRRIDTTFENIFAGLGS